MRNLTLRALTRVDRDQALLVINEAAQWYREFLPPHEHHDREMTADEWQAATRRMTWYGAFAAGALKARNLWHFLIGRLTPEKTYAEPRNGFAFNCIASLEAVAKAACGSSASSPSISPAPFSHPPRAEITHS